MKEKIPTLDEFIEHGYSRLELIGETNPERFKKSITLRYYAWLDAGWSTSKRKIKCWKSTLTHTIPYLKPETVQQNFIKNRYGIS